MTRKDISKLFIRFLITFACCLPFLIFIGYLLTDKVSDFVMVMVFVAISGVVIAFEELIHFKLYQRRQILKAEEKEKNNG